MKNKAGSVSKYITKAGDRLWRYRFDADPVDGKRQVISRQGFETRGAATKALQVAIEDYQKSKTLPIAPPPTRYVTWKTVLGSGIAPKVPSPKRMVSPPSPS